MLNEFERARLLRQFGELLNHENAEEMRTWTVRPARRKPTKGEWNEYEPGPTIYWVVAIGQPLDREKNLEDLLGAEL